MTTTELRRTASLCPICLRKIPATLERCVYTDSPEPGTSRPRSTVFMRRTCPEHGTFRVPVWKDRIALEPWIEREAPLTEKESDHCTGDCRACLGAGGPHGQDTCCVILEVTKRCNLRCTYCFAHGGETDDQPTYEELCAAIDIISANGSGPLIQLSGGEPTLRDDLPDLVRYAKAAGCRYTQINTNGIRLAGDEGYVKALAEAGLDIVFLQYDGTDDKIYRALRGRALAETKLRAIENCGKYRLGVTLVPTIVPGINDHELGNIIREAVRLFPAVRSVHFQPVTHLGRYPSHLVKTNECRYVPNPPADSTDNCLPSGHLLDPNSPEDSADNCLPSGHLLDPNSPEDSADTQSTTIPLAARYTLDDLMADLCAQTGIPETALLPSRCDHAMCEFHATFVINSQRQLVPMTDRAHDTRKTRTSAARNRQYVAEHWKRSPDEAEAGDMREEAFANNIPLVTTENEAPDFDTFVRMMRTRTMKISAMAFQDAMNIDLERLYRCSLHVYEDGHLLPFCAKYLTPANL